MNIKKISELNENESLKLTNLISDFLDDSNSFETASLYIETESDEFVDVDDLRGEAKLIAKRIEINNIGV